MNKQLKAHVPLATARVIELKLALSKCEPSKLSRIKYLEDLIELNNILIKLAEK